MADDSSAGARPTNAGARPTDNDVQKTRAWTGLLVVLGGDAAIAAAAIWGVVKFAGSQNAALVASILTSSFTAIGTLTAAYFGIRAASNTAQSMVAAAPRQTTPKTPETPG